MFRQGEGGKFSQDWLFSFCFSAELSFLTTRPRSFCLIQCLWATCLIFFYHLAVFWSTFCLPHSQVWAPFIWLYGTDTNTWPECCWMQVLISTRWSVPVLHSLTGLYTVASNVLHLPSLCLLNGPLIVLSLLLRMSKVARVLSCLRWRAVMQTWFTSSLR